MIEYKGPITTSRRYQFTPTGYKCIHHGKFHKYAQYSLNYTNILLACSENLNFMNLISESFRLLTPKGNDYNKNKNKHTKKKKQIIIITKRPIYLHDQNLRGAIPRSNTACLSFS